MRTRSSAALLAGGFILVCLNPAIAAGVKKSKHASVAVSGLAAMHTIRRVGGKLCMSDHFHYGTGASRKSRALAIRAAKRNWADFVHTEYGSRWARFSLAGGKGVKCTRTGGQYNCSIEARPCFR